MYLSLIQKTKAANLNFTNRHPCSLCCTSMFHIIFYYHLKKFSFQHQLMTCFNQIFRNRSNNFHSLIVFLRVNMLKVLLFNSLQIFRLFASLQCQKMIYMEFWIDFLFFGKRNFSAKSFVNMTTLLHEMGPWGPTKGNDQWTR